MSEKNQDPLDVTAATTTTTDPPTSPPRSKTTRSKGTSRPTAKRTTSSSQQSTVPSHVQPRRAERRPEMVRQRRDERRKAYERRQRQWLITRIGLGVVAVVIVGGLVWSIFRFASDDEATRPDGVQEFSYTALEHTASLEETVDYTERPPVAGPHAPAPYWQNCGFYDAPVQNESAVHSLEHGAVWITYKPGTLFEDQLQDLRDDAGQGYVLVTPYTEQTEPVVVTAWNNQLRLTEWDKDTIDQFVRYFRQGPQTPERGATCTGGVGTPL